MFNTVTIVDVVFNIIFMYADTSSVTVAMEIKENAKEENTNLLYLTMTFGSDYPNELPQINIASEQLTRSDCDKLKTDVVNYASSMQGEPVMMNIREWLGENWTGYCTTNRYSHTSSDNTAGFYWCLLQLDHMRSRQKYVKTILKWTKDLDIKGKLIFCGKLIFILLQGTLECIKEYISLQKTVNVDVDSKGRSCKERMLTQLCPPQPLEEEMYRFEDFQVTEIDTKSTLKEKFSSYGLASIYNEHLNS